MQIFTFRIEIYNMCWNAYLGKKLQIDEIMC